MPYEAYKLIHFFGLFLLCGSLSVLIFNSHVTNNADFKQRKMLASLHGVALVALIISGFGLVSKLGIMGKWPPWIFLKILVWMALAGATAMLKRQPKSTSWLWMAVFALFMLGAWGAVYGPRF